VWDLETVPDLGGFAAAHDLVGKSDVQVREAIGDKFPRLRLKRVTPRWSNENHDKAIRRMSVGKSKTCARRH
jgi:hypothetical protein